jgi:hypothetical protein
MMATIAKAKGDSIYVKEIHISIVEKADIIEKSSEPQLLPYPVKRTSLPNLLFTKLQMIAFGYFCISRIAKVTAG